MKKYIIYHSFVLSRRIEAEDGKDVINLGTSLLAKELQGIKNDMEELGYTVRDEIKTTYLEIEK